MTIHISQIIPTQDYIRNEKQIPGMTKFVSEDGIFTKEAIESYKPNANTPHLLMRLTQFEDGKLFLGDGHHRIIGMVEAGREQLHRDEFFIERWNYEAYQEIVFTYPDGKWMGWITPHDPRTEIRLPDLSEFKFHVKALFKREGEEVARKFILANKSKYCRPREVQTVQDLYENYLKMKASSGTLTEKYKELAESNG